MSSLLMCLSHRNSSSHCRGPLPPNFFHGFASMQTCKRSFDADVIPIVRFTLMHTFAERFEPFSVLVPLAIHCAKHRLQSCPGPFPRGLRQSLFCAHSALRLGRHSQRLSVTHGGCSRVSRAEKWSSPMLSFRVRLRGLAQLAPTFFLH